MNNPREIYCREELEGMDDCPPLVDDDCPSDDEGDVMVDEEPMDCGSSTPVTTQEDAQRVDRRSRTWCLTWNNYPSSYEGVLTHLGAARYVFQCEVGEEGTPHVQGVFYFRNARSWSSMNNKLDPKGVWSVCQNIMASVAYCQKKRSAVKGTLRIVGYANETVVDPMDGKTFYGWQLEVCSVIEGPIDDRTIQWWWSELGNIGKSSLAKHLILKYDCLFTGGDAKDIFFQITSRLKAKKVIPGCVFDLCRSNGNKIDYGAIEGIKNGMIMSTKYESCMTLFNPPHVVVFANCPPDLTMLSADRWRVHHIEIQPVVVVVPVVTDTNRFLDFNMDSADENEDFLADI